jgi:hypothetical protein
LVSLSLIEKNIPAVLVEGWFILSCDKLGRIAVPGVAAAVVFIIIDEIVDPVVMGEAEYAIG